MTVKVEDVATGPELIVENGIPVLRTGSPLEVSVVCETLEAIRREATSRRWTAILCPA